MAPHDDLLESLCHSEETLKDAKSILRIAQQKTAPGSGFELGPRRTGLPAICAYIASHRLNNTDVTRHNAQVASCLKASDFEKALFTVEAAIRDDRKGKVKKDVYTDLIKHYDTGIDRQQLLEWMAAVNRALIQSNSGLDSDDPDEGAGVKCAIFFWAYNVAMGKNLMTQQEFAFEQHISSRTFSKMLAKITNCGSSIKTRIQETVSKSKTAQNRSPAKSTVTTPRRSPKKPLRVLPSKDSPTKSKAREAGELPIPPIEHQYTDSMEAEQSSDDLQLPETPSKKRRKLGVSPTKSVLRRQSSPSTTQPPAASLITSSSRVDHPKDGNNVPTTPLIISNPSTPRRSKRRNDSSMMDVDMNDGTADSSPTRSQRRDGNDLDQNLVQQRRRFRPVYQDHKQWYALDKRIKRIWRQTELHKEQMTEKYGHPLKSLRA